MRIKADARILRLLKRGGYKSLACPQAEVPKAKSNGETFFHWTCSGCGVHRGIFREPHEGREPEMYCAACGETRPLVKGAEVHKCGSTKGEKL